MKTCVIGRGCKNDATHQCINGCHISLDGLRCEGCTAFVCDAHIKEHGVCTCGPPPCVDARVLVEAFGLTADRTKEQRNLISASPELIIEEWNKRHLPKFEGKWYDLFSPVADNKNTNSSKFVLNLKRFELERLGEYKPTLLGLFSLAHAVTNILVWTHVKVFDAAGNLLHAFEPAMNPKYPADAPKEVCFVQLASGDFVLGRPHMAAAETQKEQEAIKRQLEEETAKRQLEEETAKRQLEEDAVGRHTDAVTAATGMRRPANEQPEEAKRQLEEAQHKQEQQQQVEVQTRKRKRSPDEDAQLKSAGRVTRFGRHAEPRWTYYQAANQANANVEAQHQRTFDDNEGNPIFEIDDLPLGDKAVAQRKQEAIKRQLEEAEAQRQLEEEVVKRQLEEAEAQRQLEKAAKRQLDEEAEAKRQLEEEVVKRQLEEEVVKRQLEEEVVKRQLEEEAEAKRQLEEAEAQRQQHMQEQKIEEVPTDNLSRKRKRNPDDHHVTKDEAHGGYVKKTRKTKSIRLFVWITKEEALPAVNLTAEEVGRLKVKDLLLKCDLDLTLIEGIPIRSNRGNTHKVNDALSLMGLETGDHFLVYDEEPKKGIN